jgi:hypothetical protein
MAVRFRDRKPNAAPVTAEQKKRTALDNALREQRWQDAIDTATAEPRLLAMGKRGLGRLPLHQAAAGNAPVEVLQKLAELHPAALSTTAGPATGRGPATKDLPLHLLAMNRDASLAAFRALVQPYPEALTVKGAEQRTPLDWAKMKQAAPECLTYLTVAAPAPAAGRPELFQSLSIDSILGPKMAQNSPPKSMTVEKKLNRSQGVGAKVTSRSHLPACCSAAAPAPTRS